MTISRYTRMPSFNEATGAITGNYLFGAQRVYRSFTQSDSVYVYPTLDGDWQVTNDFNGVAYPAGIKQVRYRQTWNVDDVALMNAGTLKQDYIIAVPATLPAGYTVSTMRFENHRRTLVGLDMEKFYGVGPSLAHPLDAGYNIRIPSTQLFEYYKWGPDALNGALGNGVLYHNSTMYSASFPNTGSLFTGMRYFSFAFNTTTASAGLTPLNWKVELFRDNSANYSSPAVTLYSVIIPGGGGRYSSGALLDGVAGNFQSPTLGTRWQFHINVSAQYFPAGPYSSTAFGTTGLTNPANGNYVNWLFNAGPRLDIPLPWMVTGDDMALPGGIVSGAITGF